MARPPLAAAMEARRLLAERIPPSRLVPSRSPGTEGRTLLLKLESELPTGSFKVRGALYALLRRHPSDDVREVVASSTGNHGAAVAYAASQARLGATIFVPRGANPVKKRAIEGYGGRVVEGGRDLADAFEAAREHAGRRGSFFLNDATDPDIPAGAGTIALELAEQAPDAARLIVPVGDTALIRGVAAVARELLPGVRIVGVQAERAPAYALSWSEGRVVTTESCDTMADGLATRTPEPANVDAIRELVDDFVLVSEEELLEAIRRLLLDEHVVAEPAGAAAFAAFLKTEVADGPTVVLITGANLAPDVLERLGRR